MPPFWIVEHFDVVKDICFCIISSLIGLTLDSLPLEQLEEAFSHRIVVAVASTAMTGNKVMLFKESLPIVANAISHLCKSAMYQFENYSHFSPPLAKLKVRLSPRECGTEANKMVEEVFKAGCPPRVRDGGATLRGSTPQSPPFSKERNPPEFKLTHCLQISRL